MHLRRVFVGSEIPQGDFIPLSGEEAHYLLRVLRLRVGDEVSAFNGRGWSARADVEETGREFALLRIRERREAAPRARGFSVAQAMLKSEAMDTVVRLCTELGASSLIFFTTGRSIPRHAGGDTERAKLARWQRIALGACRQSRRDFIPPLSILPSLAALGEKLGDYDMALVASLREGSAPLAGILSSVRGARCKNLLLIVGPEGDFSDEEHAQLISCGVVPCMLSDAVLRAETAAFTGAALLGHYLLSYAEGGRPRGRQ